MKRTTTRKLCAFIDEWLYTRCNRTRAAVLEQVCDEVGARAEDGDRTAARHIEAWRRGAVP